MKKQSNVGVNTDPSAPIQNPQFEQDSTWDADIEGLNQLWPGEPHMTAIQDAFKVRVLLGEKDSYEAPTHLFDDAIRILPYHDADNVTDRAGNQILRGDIILSRIFAPGQIGFAIKHHRPNYRQITADMQSDELKEHLKLQDTHIELVIGVERDGNPGVITLNNPQDYQRGRFGDASYPMIFVKPVYPSYLPDAQKSAFENNIRSMMVGFNAVSNFPDEYNGGDPLAAYDVAKIAQHGKQMMLAIAGDKGASSEARVWFRKPENLIYCAELAHVASSAGLVLPLNSRTFVPLVGESVWTRFTELVSKHNQGQSTPFVELNDNKLCRFVKLQTAPDGLLPISDYAPATIRHVESTKLAFLPMTMADIVEHAIAAYVPREQLGEKVAPIQSKILEKMKPGLIEAMGMGALPQNDPRRQSVELLFGKIIETIAVPYENYPAFRTALAPYLADARKITGPRPGTEMGKGFFVPPSLLHLVAQNKHSEGLLGLKYVGHGLHFSLLRRRS